MLWFVFKNIYTNKDRFLLSIGGVALAVLLILVLRGIALGAIFRVNNYVDHTAADIYVLQKGASNLYRPSILPKGMDQVISAIEGVSSVSSIVITTGDFWHEDRLNYMLLVGYEAQKGTGGPWKIAQGKIDPKPGEIILDRVIARKNNIKLGDSILIREKKFKVVGLAEGSSSLIGSFSFVNIEDAWDVLKLQRVATHFLLQVAKSNEALKISQSLEEGIPDIVTLTKEELLQNNRSSVEETILPPINIMVVVGFLISLAIVALTIYTTTVEKTRQYAILKAIGASKKKLYLLALSEVWVNVFLGFSLGWVLSFLAKTLIESLVPEVMVLVNSGLLLRVFLLTIPMGLIASFIPARYITKIDPAILFKEV